MDFYRIYVKKAPPRSADDYIVTVDFLYGRTKDLVCKGGKFFAWYDPRLELWNTDRIQLFAHIDAQIECKYQETVAKHPDAVVVSRMMTNHGSGLVTLFDQYCKQMTTEEASFDSKIFFKSDKPKKRDFATSKLSYDPEDIPTPAFDELMNVLYDEDQQKKIRWFMGVLLTGQSLKVQKFMYLYGSKGSGKGTVINIFKDLFKGYIEEINLSQLTSSSEFATSGVKETPLLIDEDSDISKIANDTNLLKLTAHEPILVNKKYFGIYPVTFSGLLITASNQRYQVRNIDSGITRRAVVVEPSGRKLKRSDYSRLVDLVKFELPGIAYKVMAELKETGLHYYDDEMDVAMLEATDLIFSFIREHYDKFEDVMTLGEIASMYKEFLDDLGFDTKGYKRRIKLEMQRYFEEFSERKKIDGLNLTNVFSGFKRELVYPEEYGKMVELNAILEKDLGLKDQHSILDRLAESYPAQEANEHGTPSVKWDNCKTTMKDVDSTQLHYVRLPLNHIVIDFDLKDGEGKKDIRLNVEAASHWPETYAEVSKSGNGIHLHYYYDGDVTKLASEVEDDIEVKVFTGKSSLRRKLGKCNSKPIATISTGIPEKEVVDVNTVIEDIAWNEKKLRTMIEKNIRKEYHGATKPSVDFIAHVLEQAVASGTKFDVSDMKTDVFIFAMNSSNNADYCLAKVNKMIFSTLTDENGVMLDSEATRIQTASRGVVKDEDIWFYDIEVYPNLFVIAYKQWHKPETRTVLFNPTPKQVEDILNRPLIGYNCRRYDNHIMYSARNHEPIVSLYNQSQAIVNGDTSSGMMSGAYELSYADIYEYASKKQSLKKWQIELGIKHDEAEFPWDQPVDKKDWNRIGEYCLNDVDSTESVFDASYADYKARVIMSQLSGLSVNSTTQQHAAKFLFGDDPRPQEKFVYTDLSTIFPGYKYSFGKSEYMGEDPSEGGLVRHKAGVWENVELDDVVSMHPHAAKALNYFGPYQERFNQLIDARVAVKHHNFELARTYFNGALTSYLTEDDADDLAYALKIIINIVYGMTSAKFDNKFRHPKNVDNIIAKYGALFMITLKNELEKMNVNWVHIKTDSIKIVDCTPEVRQFIFDFGKKYGFEFEHEATYSRMALVNKSVYIAQYGWADKASKIGTWDAVGAQYAEPYVFKTLFSKESLVDGDYAVVKEAKSPIYIDERFIGKIARVYPSLTGGVMTRRPEGKNPAAVTGTKGYKWKLFDEGFNLDDVDMAYYNHLIQDAIDNIDKVGEASKMIDGDLKEMFEYLPF